MKPNQMNLLKCVAGLNLLIAPIALAQTGDRGGNGGDAIVCQDGSIRMLDTIEAIRAGTPPRLSTRGSTIRDKVELLLSRQNEKDQSFGNELRERAEIFLTDIESFESTGSILQPNTVFGEGELPNVPDEGATFVPAGCKIEQLIVRTRQPLPNQKLYSVRKELWTQMNTDEKATAIMHEAIYGYLVDQAESYKIRSQSPSARWYNGILISNTITSFKDQDLYKEMGKFEIVRDRWSRTSDGFTFNPLEGADYAADGSLAKIQGRAQFDQSVQFAFFNYVVATGSSIELKAGKWIKIALPDFCINLDTKQVVGWPVNFDKKPTAKLKDINPMRDNDVICFNKATMEKTDRGYRVTNAQKMQWRTNLGIYTPAAFFVLAEGHCALQRWTPATLEFDQSMNLIKFDYEKRSWNKMNLNYISEYR